MPIERPRLVILAGANGAGKTTASTKLLRGVCNVGEFVNADTIARGLSEFDPSSVALEAGRIMIGRIRALTAKRASFAIETTLASRTLAGLIKANRLEHSYYVHLFFLWVRSADLAVSRVAERVRLGGHSIPEPVIRRRYDRGITNLTTIYRHLVDEWHVYDNSGAAEPRLVAKGGMSPPELIFVPEVWDKICRE